MILETIASMQAQVAARDQDEAEHDARQRGECLSIRPLDPL